MSVIAIIPARSGSKGIPNKNIKMLGGKPLIQYSIEVALNSKLIDKVVVSTDNEAIAEVSIGLGAEVPGLRPPHLATDDSPTIDTLVYTLELYKNKGFVFETLCLLQPTSPFRKVLDVDYALQKFQKTKTDSLISVKTIPHEYNPHWAFLEKNEGLLSIATGDKKIIPRRQELPNAYIRNGAIYITQSKIILERNSLYGDSIGYYLMADDNQVNLDTMDDWNEAAKIINYSKQLQ